MRLPFGVFIVCIMSGCGLILDFDPTPGESDAGSARRDASSLDAFVSADTGMDDGAVNRDASFEAGMDGGYDAALSDADIDADVPDAGPPRVLVFRYERTDLPDPDILSVWVSEDGAVWRSVACVGGIRETVGIWQCTHDRQPLPVGQRLRFYFDYSLGGISPACGSTLCYGVHIAKLDGVDQGIIEEPALDTPAAPGATLLVHAFTTPP